MTVADFMAEALWHPTHGYYAVRDPLGAAGDFVTAPEISQMFGELIGAWCAVQWQAMGRPDPVRLVELGPGRGTLMADALRATARVAGFHDALSIHLVEGGAVLRERQRAVLPPTVTWHDGFDSVPGGPMLLVANEFFDALPDPPVRARGSGVARTAGRGAGREIVLRPIAAPGRGAVRPRRAPSVGSPRSARPGSPWPMRSARAWRPRVARR